MSTRYLSVIRRNTAHLDRRLAKLLSKRKLLRAAHVMAPTLVALTFAGAANVARAQGTMDFSGAQTLMGTFKTFFSNPYPTFKDMNNLSLVTFLEYDGCGIVIPGDLERAGWEELLKQPSFCQCLRETNFFIASNHGRNAGYCEAVFDYCKPHIILLSDKNIVHDSQEHDYTKHAKGIAWPNGQTRRVLTTRCDGHIRITKQIGQPSLIAIGIEL
jgi:beta-lactamase superfamily II metal-dependent hydrolase